MTVIHGRLLVSTWAFYVNEGSFTHTVLDDEVVSECEVKH